MKHEHGEDIVAFDAVSSSHHIEYIFVVQLNRKDDSVSLLDFNIDSFEDNA